MSLTGSDNSALVPTVSDTAPLNGTLAADAIERLLSQLEIVSEHPATALAVELTYQEAGWLLKVNPRTVRRFVESGQLAGHRLGGRPVPRVTLFELLRFIDESPRVEVKESG